MQIQNKNQLSYVISTQTHFITEYMMKQNNNLQKTTHSRPPIRTVLTTFLKVMVVLPWITFQMLVSFSIQAVVKVLTLTLFRTA